MRHELGFALPAALFLLVVLATLAGWLMHLTQVGLAQDSLELEGERAWQAAQSGLEAGLYAVTVNDVCRTQDLAFGGHLARFVATVSCVRHTANEAGQTIRLYQVTSVACNDPLAVSPRCPNPSSRLPEYAERHVAATVED